MPTKDEERMVEAGAQAGRLSKEAIGAEQGEPGKYDLILSPTVAADIIAGVPGSANPFLILIGLSPLGDRMGEEIAPDFMTVTDHPHIAGALGSHRFDFEGTPTREVRIVENGILKSLVHNTTTAMMYETKSTGSSALQSISEGSKMLLPGNSNIVFEAGDHSFEELIDGNKPTIYVTCNWYTRFQNYQTGEFSTIPRDAMFLVKNGEMTPIKNLRISDNLMRMFANIDALGKDLKQILWWEVPIPTFVPYVRVSDCTMTAATQ
jgi:PmbA protein